MIKYFQKAFKITNDSIILATPLVLFLFLLSLYIGVAQNAPVNLPSLILHLVTILFMISAFLAGWFYMVKKAVDLDKKEFIIDQDKAKASFGLIKEFPIGIGEYFLSFLGTSILYVLLIFILLLACYKIGMHYIGDIGISATALRDALNSSEAMKAMVASLSKEQLLKLNSWNVLFLVATSIYSFVTMFWPAQIVFKTKNSFMALVKSIGVILKKPFSVILLFLYVSLVNFVISLVNAFSTVNPILYFVSMLLYFYFLVYVIVLIFLYYDREMQPNNKIQDESQEQGNRDSGTDSIGQDDESDKPSEGE